MVDKDSTVEQCQAYLAALESEKDGYVARVARAQAGRIEPLTEQALADRAAQVDAEIKRVRALLGGKKKQAAAE